MLRTAGVGREWSRRSPRRMLVSCAANPLPYNGISSTNGRYQVFESGITFMAEWQRTHTCGELRDTHIGQTVVLNGWVNTVRRYNDQVFVDLRDRYGITQVVIESGLPNLTEIAKEIAREYV